MRRTPKSTPPLEPSTEAVEEVVVPEPQAPEAAPADTPTPEDEYSDRILLHALLASIGIGKWAVLKNAAITAAREDKYRLVIEPDPFTLGVNVMVRLAFD